MNSGLSLGNGGSTGTRSSDSGDFSITGRELIVVAKSDVELRVRGEGLSSAVGVDVGSLQNLLSSEGVKLSPLFGMTEDRIKKEVSTLASKKGKDLPDLSVYYQVQAPDERLDVLADSLRRQEVVSGSLCQTSYFPCALA